MFAGLLVSPEELHDRLRRSAREVITPACGGGFRDLLESGSAEAFLTDLLFIQLRADGLAASREFPIDGRTATDLVIHGAQDLFVEMKQLHLKDACRFAPGNLARDLSRHDNAHALGVMYVVDERDSKSVKRFARFRDANRQVCRPPR